MAVNRPVPWLIAYDIREKRRLGRIYRYLCGQATPVQYSVFMARASAGQIGQVAKALEQLIERRGDDVRIYRIPEPAEAVVRGRCLLPEGVLLLSTGGEITRTGEIGIGEWDPFHPDSRSGIPKN